MDLWRIVSAAQVSNNFGYGPSWIVAIVCLGI